MLYQPTGRIGPWPRPATRAFGLLHGLFYRYLAWELDRFEIERLRALDDRTLADMGIERSTIASVFRAHRRARRAGLRW